MEEQLWSIGKSGIHSILGCLSANGKSACVSPLNSVKWGWSSIKIGFCAVGLRRIWIIGMANLSIPEGLSMREMLVSPWCWHVFPHFISVKRWGFDQDLVRLTKRI